MLFTNYTKSVENVESSNHSVFSYSKQLRLDYLIDFVVYSTSTLQILIYNTELDMYYSCLSVDEDIKLEWRECGEDEVIYNNTINYLKDMCSSLNINYSVCGND